jgi:hypothetical protein
VSSTDRLVDEITTLAAHITAATARWLTLIAEFDEGEAWAALGAKSCAHWLSWMCGVSPFTAREHVRVARRLQDFPLVAAAFARGELSYSKVRALTRVEDVADEAGLVELARAASASQLERIVRGYRSCLAVEEGEQRLYAERSLSWRYDDDGALVLHGRFAPEQGALLVQALESARDALGPPPRETEDVSAETLPRHDVTRVRARNADALMAVAEASLEETGNSTSADRYQVVVHVDAEALQRPAPDNDAAAGRCELDEGVPLTREAARRLTCDAAIVRILERDGKPLSVGRRTRTIAPALRRALRSRDGGCAFPGCTTTRHVDAHHIEHWVDGGRTDLSNLVQLCRHHHRLLHEGGFSVGRRGDAFAFYAPDGRHLPHSPRPRRGDCDALVTNNDRRRVRVSAETSRPTDGRPMDLGLAVDHLLNMRPPRRE